MSKKSTAPVLPVKLKDCTTAEEAREWVNRVVVTNPAAVAECLREIVASLFFEPSDEDAETLVFNTDKEVDSGADFIGEVCDSLNDLEAKPVTSPVYEMKPYNGGTGLFKHGEFIAFMRSGGAEHNERVFAELTGQPASLLDDPEKCAAIIAGLRLLQQHAEGKRINTAGIEDILTREGASDGLDAYEMEALAEEVNFGAPAVAKQFAVVLHSEQQTDHSEIILNAADKKDAIAQAKKAYRATAKGDGMRIKAGDIYIDAIVSGTGLTFHK